MENVISLMRLEEIKTFKSTLKTKYKLSCWRTALIQERGSGSAGDTEQEQAFRPRERNNRGHHSFYERVPQAEAGTSVTVAGAKLYSQKG